MARKLKEGAAVAYFSAEPGKDWPNKINWDGPGFYTVESDDDNDHTNADFGKRVEFVLNKPNEPGVPADPENNEGHFVYAGASEGDDE